MTFADRQLASVRRAPAYLQVGAPMAGLIMMVGVFLALASTEPALAFASVIVLIAGAKLLWRPGEPPILFAAFFLQWLQISTAVFRATFTGVELPELYDSSGVIKATWLSLFGLMVIVGGVRVALHGVRPARSDELTVEIRRCSLKRALGAYWIAQIVFVGMEAATWIDPGFVQAIIALNSFRWMFFFFVAVIALGQKRGYWLLAIVTAFEITRGLLSFFSSYQTVFLILALALLTARPKLNVRTLTVTAVIFGMLVVLASAWSVIKTNYRDLLSAGTGRQIILVSPTEQLEHFSDLFFGEGLTRLPEGFEKLIQRIEYTYFFSRVVERVPAVLPYDDGAFWSGALMHVLTPRLIFSDKAALAADVLDTQRYTGITLIWGTNQDTEIPMGYMAQSYIDFGPIGMFVPIFLLGLLYGGQYRYIITRKKFLMLAYGALPVAMMSMSKFESSAAKILGGSLTTFAVFVVAFALFAPKIYSMLLDPAAKRVPPGFASSDNF